MKPEPLFSDARAAAELCERHGIGRLALFGSELRGTARPDSDVDLLVEFRPGRVPGFLGIAQIEEELSCLLGGRKVDLRTAADLSRYFRVGGPPGSHRAVCCLTRSTFADITGMLNRLIHIYFDVNHDILWQTATQDVPSLAAGFEVPDPEYGFDSN